MPDYRALFEKAYVGAWDLPQGRDAVVVIERVEAGTITNGTKKDKKPIVFFRGKDKPFICNATNAKAIAGMYGNKTEDWIGKPISLYVTTTSMGGKEVDCIRVRPTPPQPRKRNEESQNEEQPS